MQNLQHLIRGRLCVFSSRTRILKYYTQNLQSARVPAPRRILSRELEARGLPHKDLADIMALPVQTINEIIRGSKQITSETAMELSQALGTSPEFWMNLEAKYRLHLAKKENIKQDIARS